MKKDKMSGGKVHSIKLTPYGVDGQLSERRRHLANGIVIAKAFAN